MSFRDQSWGTRIHKMGDQAEEQFRKWARRNQLSVERLGWDRPKMGVKKMSTELKHLPDFYGSDGYLYEVVGMGADGKLKGIKVAKWEALKFWNRVQPVRVFVFSSKEKKVVLLPWPTLVQMVARARRLGVEAFKNDGNKYYPVLWEWLEPYTVGEVGDG